MADDEPDTEERAVTRLLDMEVEEVSLVDRAANKRRFLIVKRSNTAMAKKKGTAQNAQNDTDDQDLAAADGGGGDDTPDSDDADDGLAGADAADAGDAGDADDGGAGAGDPAAAPASQAAGDAGATAAAAAGDGATADAATLTKAVLQMTEAVQELATVVDAVSQRVDSIEKAARKKPAAAAGATSDDDTDDLDDADDDEPTPPRKRTRKASPVTQALTKVRSSFGVKPPAKPGDENFSAITKMLQGISTDVGTIKTGLAEQKSRIHRLEKQTGLPSSLPADGNSGKRKTGTVSWPLDLNSPVDRDSVSKDVSFHQ
jgi:hypothetical protein